GAGGSVWYTWTAPSTGVVEINTAGSDGDTVVAVYTGGSVGSLTLVGANDDGDAVLGRFSRLLVPVTQGTTYRIAVDGAGGGSGILRTRVVPPSRSGFTPMRPTRLVDTRDGTGYSGGRIGGVAEVLQVQVAGNVGIPTTAQAAVMNVTVVAPDASGYLSVYPCDSPVLGSSSLNYGAGETIPNLVVTRTDGNGRVCVYSKAGAHVV
ncbi:MAG: hypothetical protein KDB37_22795, partial [Ilumatobacter sp.]|nr:hypothetical protein [Ilumatobacter sp.]